MINKGLSCRSLLDRSVSQYDSYLWPRMYQLNGILEASLQTGYSLCKLIIDLGHQSMSNDLEITRLSLIHPCCLERLIVQIKDNKPQCLMWEKHKSFKGSNLHLEYAALERWYTGLQGPMLLS